MSRDSGLFISRHLLNKELHIFISLVDQTISYADGSVESYKILHATPIKFDQESGILVCKSHTGSIFYINEEYIDMFWEANSGFSLSDNTTATVRKGTKLSNKGD